MAIISVAAVAQTSSPFASKKKKQAWETDAARPAPATPSYQAPTYQAPSYQAPSYQAPRYNPPPAYGQPPAIAPAPAPVSTQSYQPAARAPRTAVPPAPISAPSASQPTLQRPASGTASAPANAPRYGSYPAYQAAPAHQAAQNAPQHSYNQQSYNNGAAQNSAVYRPAPPAASKAVPDAVPQELLPGYRPSPAGAYYPGRADKGGFSVAARAPRGAQSAANYPAAPQQQTYSAPQNYSQKTAGAYANQPASQNYQGQNYQGQNYQGQTYQGQSYQKPQNLYATAPKRGWKQRLGLTNLATSLRGFLKLGAAALNRKDRPAAAGTNEGWGEAFIADAMIAGEVSAITQGGLEYGIGAEVRGQYDEFRRGFGGLTGNCGTAILDGVQGCNAVLIDGTVRALRGHSSQFYSAGVNNAVAEEFALEGAYVFLRSAYGDFTAGRDDGAAYLFSLGAPTLLAVNASNSPVDYTGLDSVKTVNDASGFAEKIAYVSPRLLGDQIGVGVQIGASYAPNARACGVDYCVRRNGRDVSTALSPDLRDVAEFGIALDRKFGNGLSLEATASYARASEASGIAGFDDLSSFGLGLEGKYGAWTLGGSFLNSNNGLSDGDYQAFDVGLTWKPARWGLSLAYGHAEDDNVNLVSDQGTVGFVYDFERFTLGTGVQYIERSVTEVTGGIAAPRKEKGTALFIEGAVKF